LEHRRFPDIHDSARFLAVKTARIAISIGDPVGIGPEVVVKALRVLLATGAPLAGASVEVHGPRVLFDRLARALDLPLPEGIVWVDPTGGEPADSGQLQVASLESALGAVLAGRAGALCTAPITKAAAHAAGFSYPGHTEYLAARCGVRRVAMMLAGPTLRVVPLTGHVALREVAARLDEATIADGIELTVRALHELFAIAHPRVALAALNPHAGEQGLMGVEEARVLAPGIARARVALVAAGIGAEIVGPLPADGLFVHREGLDAVVCCYHDQAMIPLKILHRDEGVNLTLGLPIVRTSPAHGSALDIAGRGVARPESMIAALQLAAELAALRAR
jgi:4-hydroxythreonine-4-phosphate dehydrogenase